MSLYKIDEYYFVLDGNHRVSVYRYHGVEWIDADVTEFRTPLPKDRKDERCPRERYVDSEKQKVRERLRYRDRARP